MNLWKTYLEPGSTIMIGRVTFYDNPNLYLDTYILMQ